ncbi:MAG TPA: hypothetical protein VMU67_05505 [Steroidobacteraceae bacterium]|nr:hypothetical protein [Steroidobacteraceae bacterium]
MSHSKEAIQAPRKRATRSSRANPSALHDRWERLHAGDREPWPDERRVRELARANTAVAPWVAGRGGPAPVAAELQAAWGAFHAGQYREGIERGAELGALGAQAANKAAAVHSINTRESGARVLKILESAVERGERAVEVLPDCANAHYMLALVLGRLSQRISVLKALSAGFGGRVRTHLERALELEPRHAEAHVALGLYHAEIVGRLGALAARLTYGASRDGAIEHFRRALDLAPHSPIVSIEYANGLLVLDPHGNREQARALYERAAACEPLDAMERLDVGRARRGLD